MAKLPNQDKIKQILSKEQEEIEVIRKKTNNSNWLPNQQAGLIPITIHKKLINNRYQ